MKKILFGCSLFFVLFSSPVFANSLRRLHCESPEGKRDKAGNLTYVNAYLNDTSFFNEDGSSHSSSRVTCSIVDNNNNIILKETTLMGEKGNALSVSVQNSENNFSDRDSEFSATFGYREGEDKKLKVEITGLTDFPNTGLARVTPEDSDTVYSVSLNCTGY